jgi:hypothetical protein
MIRPRRGIGTTMVVVTVIVVLVVATMAFVVLSLQTSTPPHGTQSNASSASSSSSSSSSTSSTCASSSQIATASTNESAVFNLQTMPSNFTVGDYRFLMVYNGTGYAYTSNGSPMVNLGYNLVFNITQGSEAQTVMFGSAPPAPYPPAVPSPSTATAFDGDVHMQWVATCAAIFFEVTTQPGSAKGTSTEGYDVTFQQIGACSPVFWGVPWSVTIGDVTEAQPPNTKLPLDNNSLSGTSNSSLSTITFSLANGTYDYRVSPSAEFFTPTSGTVNVSGANVTVEIAYTGTSCITTTQTSSTGNKAG